MTALADFEIRKMVYDDIGAVMEIEYASFSLPWNREAFEFELKGNEHAVYYVGEYQGKIVTYCGAWVIIDQAMITNIAVLPDFRQKGFGEAILQHILSQCKEKQVKQISLEVRVSNQQAQHLYRKNLFQAGGIRKGYYSDNYEDALLMWRSL